MDLLKILLMGIFIPMMFLINGINPAFATQAANCSEVNCPPLSEIDCPEDSFVRETNTETNVISSPNHYETVEEIFIQCCVTQKCACRTCHIPSCHNSSLVLMETKPETPIPGKCCGEYECISEPICGETVTDTDNYWLTDCKRCKCTEGKKECIVVCDQMMPVIPPSHTNFSENNNIDEDGSNSGGCFSQSLNQFFLSGEKWKEDDDCTECECFGEHAKCEDLCTDEPIPTILTNEIHPEQKACISNNLEKVFSNGEEWNEDNCTHCQCVSGAKICQNACEDKLFDRIAPSNCISIYLKRSFGNNETWLEDNGCSQCKCEYGEKHCQTSFCKPTHCKKEIKIPGECCPRCADDPTTLIPSTAIIINNTEISQEFNTTTPVMVIPEEIPQSSTEFNDNPPEQQENNQQADDEEIIDRVIEQQPIHVIAEQQTQTPVPITSTTPLYKENNDNNDQVAPQDQKQLLPPPCVDQINRPNSDLVTVLAVVVAILVGVVIVLSIFALKKCGRSIRSYDPVVTDDNFNDPNCKPMKITYSCKNELEKVTQNGKIEHEK